MTAPTKENQTHSLHGPNLILDVENFGPIAEAKNIEFKPMTVFVGPSNTGKTYLAVLTHALLRARHEVVPPRSNLVPIRNLGPQFIETDALRKFTSNLRSIISHIPQASELSSDSQALCIDVNQLSKGSLDFLGKFVDDTLRLTAARYEIFLQRYFEVDSSASLSNYSTKGDCVPSIAWTKTSGNIVISTDISLTRCRISDTQFRIGRGLEELLRSDWINETPELEREVLKSMTDFLVMVLDDLVYSHYIPSGRSGIMNSRHLLAAQLTAREDQNYNLLARDFLSALVAIREKRARPLFPSRRFTSVRPQSVTNLLTERAATLIEDSVLNGRVLVEDSGEGLADFYFAEGENRVPMTSAASSVADLAPVVMFLRSFVQIGDLIIIDEPEAHLHPTAQQQIAAALAFTVRSGIRVLITTHSHYMVEQLSNFVMAAKLDQPQERKRLLGISGQLGDEDIYLDNDEIAVYDFAPQSPDGGSIVKPVPFEDGYYPEDHMRAISRQFNRNNRIESAVLGPE